MPENRRRHARKQADLDFEYQVEGGERKPAHAKDMSLGGMYAEAPDEVDFGAKVAVYIHFPGARKETRLDGTVRWVKPGGIGVQFGALGARETYYLTEFLAECEDVPEY